MLPQPVIENDAHKAVYGVKKIGLCLCHFPYSWHVISHESQQPKLPIGEAILGSIGEMIGYIIFELVLEGIGRFCRWTYYGIRKLLTGREREISGVTRLENIYLYKKIVLRKDLNQYLTKGTQGTVTEVIDEEDFFVEFEDLSGKPIEVKGQQVFKVRRKEVMLARRKRTKSNRR